MGTIMWNCYKAGCCCIRWYTYSLTADDIRKILGHVAEETHVSTFSNQIGLCVMTAKIRDFCDQWELDPQDLGLMYDVKEHRVVFPVVHDGVTVDATGRSLGNRIPKWKRYGKSDCHTLLDVVKRL